MLDGRDWSKVEGASPESLNLLASVAPTGFPVRLIELLRVTDGGEGPLPVQPLWFCLYPAAEIAQIERDGTFKEFFPSLFVVGGNGGGEAVAIDLREPTTAPVVSFDMTNIDLKESVRHIANDFEAFVDLIGKE
ncbi:MAG: hypothetical protein ABS87_13000 [Sphingomonas sp. SCN 67-18]|uniref:SMI1/KNR4 family protein n=1 Tax=uncultured Sphingomonas sp. TaxID=158754 RepID=UPI00086C1A25|nr:SMI1/KNR4 family protein [Sphingomonas sp. SCN 67-18]ODU19816.1 MAG: hypothetical protein ABS87_13000 [Sphingomonas sp. SCN 67-18]